MWISKYHCEHVCHNHLFALKQDVKSVAVVTVNRRMKQCLNPKTKHTFNDSERKKRKKEQCVYKVGECSCRENAGLGCFSFCSDSLSIL